jgi:hypothetical protein
LDAELVGSNPACGMDVDLRCSVFCDWLINGPEEFIQMINESAMLLWNPKVHKELSLIPVTGLSHEPD